MKNKLLSILYVGPTNFGGTCLQRRDAFIRLGYNVVTINTSIKHTYNSVFYRLFRRIGVYVDVGGVNAKILKNINTAIDVIWIDKGLIIKNKTLVKIKNKFPKIEIVSYSPDDMMNTDNQSRQYKRAISTYSCHITTKSYNIKELRDLGAQEVFFVNNSFDPVSHKPQKQNYKFDVGFIGTYENERAEILLNLAKSGLNIAVWGNWPKLWRKNLSNSGVILHSGEVVGSDYATAVAQCKINLCFLRKVNRDLQTTRSVEIPAMRGFMLAEKSNEHLSLFVEDFEAVFFSTEEELKIKIDKYLSENELRDSIAKNGYMRCKESDYSNDRMIEICLKHIFKKIRREWRVYD